MRTFTSRTRIVLFFLFGFQVALGFLSGGLILTTLFVWLGSGRLVWSLGPWGSLVIAVPGFLVGGTFFAFLDRLTLLPRGVFALVGTLAGLLGVVLYAVGVIACYRGASLAAFLGAPGVLLGGLLRSGGATLPRALGNPLGSGLVALAACPFVAWLIYPHARRFAGDWLSGGQGEAGAVGGESSPRRSD